MSQAAAATAPSTQTFNCSQFNSAVLLMLASQRIESVIDFSDEPEINTEELTKRGAAPTFIEWMILSWVSGK
jgi:transient receptor potential cation channel subfamily C protein 4